MFVWTWTTCAMSCNVLCQRPSATYFRGCCVCISHCMHCVDSSENMVQRRFCEQLTRFAANKNSKQLLYTHFSSHWLRSRSQKERRKPIPKVRPVSVPDPYSWFESQFWYIQSRPFKSQIIQGGFFESDWFYGIHVPEIRLSTNRANRFFDLAPWKWEAHITKSSCAHHVAIT